jgi:DNA anti-recombination protein RmuC
MKEKIFQVLSRQRSELLSAQQRAGMEMQELEQRLEQLHAPLQERIQAYEKRIEELEKDLAAKGEENRELIGARITAAKQRLSAERDRGRFGTN